MKAKNVILALGGLGVAGAGYYFYKQYKVASEVDYDFKNFRVEGASANNAVLGMDIVIDNKTNLNLKVYGVKVEAFLNDSKVGEATNRTLTLLPKKSVSSLPLSVNVNLSALGTSVASVVSNLNAARSAELSIKGKMDFGTGILRVSNYDFDYKENLASIILQSI